MRRRSVCVVFLVIILTFMVSVAYAGCGQNSRSQGYSGKDKVANKASFLMENKDELGLTDEQVKKIKDIELEAKKDAIRADADIEIAALDIEAAMKEDVIDAEAVDALIDKKYELKKKNAKASVKAYAELKGVLTADQKLKMKDMMKNKMRCKMEGMTDKGMMKEGNMGMGMGKKRSM